MGVEEGEDVVDGGMKTRSIVDWRTRFAERYGQYGL